MRNQKKTFLKIGLVFLIPAAIIFSLYVYFYRYEFLPSADSPELSETSGIRDLLDSDKTFVFAHQGDHFFTDPDSMDSVRRAAERGYDGVEIDISLTEDKIPVLFHDSSVAVDGSERDISSLSLSEIRNHNIHIDTLESVLSAFGNQIFFILEMKAAEGYTFAEISNSVCGVIQKTKTSERIILSSLDRNLIKGIPASCPGMIYMYEINTAEKLNEFIQDEEYRSPIISIGNYLLAKPAARQILRRSEHLSVFTPRFDTEFELVMTLKPRIIQTDRPGALKQFLMERKKNKIQGKSGQN